jgi:glycosyltransferase involved in cell wall biosynthesis
VNISVVIPCYNVDRFIEDCLRSVLSEDHPVDRIICVDDASTDGTIGIIQQLQAEFPLIELLRHTERKGANAARNTGLRSCASEYIQFLDADDRLETGKLSLQSKLAEEHASAGAIIGDYVEYFEDGRKNIVRSEYTDPWMALAKGKLGTTSADLWKKAAVIAAGGWDENLQSSQDHELLFRMLKLGAPVIFDRTANTRILKRQSGSISRTNLRENWMRYIDLRRKIKAYLQVAHPAKSEVIAELDRLIFGALQIIGRMDPGLATKEYHRIFPKGYIPRRPAHSYWLHRLFAFAAALRIKRFIGR